MIRITSSKCFRPLAALVIIFIVTAAVGSLTASIYANAFFYCAKGIVISFCAFLAIDVLRWLDRTALEENQHQSNAQEIGWTVAVLLFMGYFLWRRWYHFSLWQIWLTAIVMAVLLIGMLIRLFGKWDVDCVRWITWTTCCAAVTVGILGTIVLFRPLTIEETTELIHVETCNTNFSFHHIDSSKKAESPLGYYILSPEQVDGEFSYGTGRAVLYFGDEKEAWRTAEPGSQKYYGKSVAIDGTVFHYKGASWDVTQLTGSEYSKLVYNLYEYRHVGNHILVLGSIGKNADFYGVFNTETQEFEQELAAAHLIYQEDSIQSTVYSLEKSIYRYDGSLIKTLDLDESEYIYDISFDETGNQLLVDIACNSSDNPPRQEVISLT